MIPGIYSSANALNFQIRQQEAIAHNLANVNTVGFRRTVLTVEQMAKQGGDLTATAGKPTTESVVREKIDFSHGPTVRTDRALDFALDGDGFFSVQAERADGSKHTLYTRSGHFHLNASQQLVTGDGHLVLSGGGPLTFPTGDQEITVDREGNVRSDQALMGKLDIVHFDNKELLHPVGAALFSAPPDAQPTSSTASVVQYSLESANTSAVAEMVLMIAGMRSFEATQRTMRTVDEALRQYINMDQ